MVRVAIMMHQSMRLRPATHVRHTRYANSLCAAGPGTRVVLIATPPQELTGKKSSLADTMFSTHTIPPYLSFVVLRVRHPSPNTHSQARIRAGKRDSAFLRHGQVPTLAIADTIHTPDPPNLPKIQCFRRWYRWSPRCRRSKNCMYLFAPSINLPSLARIPFYAFRSYVRSWAHPCSRKLYAAHLLLHVSWSC